MLSHAEQKASSVDIHNNDGCLQSDALSTNDRHEVGCFATLLPTSDAALGIPQQCQHRPEGKRDTKGDENGVHLIEPVGNIENLGDTNGIVLVNDDYFAVRDESPVEEHVRGCAG